MLLLKSIPVITVLFVCFTEVSGQKAYNDMYQCEHAYGQKITMSNTYWFIDKDDQTIIEGPGDYASDFSNGGLNAYENLNDNIIERFEGESENLDTTSKLKRPIYDSTSSMNQGFAFVILNGKYGFINSNGKLVTPIKYEKVSFSYNGRQGMLNGTLYEIDDNGEEVGIADYTNPGDRTKYDEAVWIGNYNVRIKNGNKYGLLDREYRLLSPCKWDAIGDFYQLQAIIKLKGRYGAIDYAGKVVIPVIYDTIIAAGDFSSNYNVKLNGKWGICGSYSCIPCLYDNELFFYEKISHDKVRVAVAVKAGKYGYIDAAGTTVVDFIYQKASSFYNGHSIVKSKNKYGIINSIGQLVVPPLYDSISVMSANGQAAVKLNGRYGLMSKIGNLVEPIKYDAIVFDEYGAVGLLKGAKVDLTGRVAKKEASTIASAARLEEYKKGELERNFDTDYQITEGAKHFAKWGSSQEIFTYKNLYGVRSTGYAKQIQIYPVMTSIKESYGASTLECVYDGKNYTVTVNRDNSLEYTTVCGTCSGTGYTSTFEKGGTLTREKKSSYNTKDYYNNTKGKVTTTYNEVTVVPSTTTRTVCNTCHGRQAKGKLKWKSGKYFISG